MALRVLGGLVGALLILYALALATFGMEDVGGPKVAVPVALGLIALGALALFLALRKRKNAAG